MVIKGLGWTFDTVAEEYDKYRPVYVSELYKDIFSYVDLTAESNVLEIGIGTGQATQPIIETGCNLITIELGEKLAEITRKNFKEYTNIKVENLSFENYTCKNSSFDFIYSASAFHWINEEEGYNKVYKILKGNGVFARFASHPFTNIEGQEELFEKTQWIYFKYMPNPLGLTAPKALKRYKEEDAERRSDIAKKYGFSDIQTKVYYRDLTFTSDEYINRLGIEIDKIALPSDVRTKFLHEFKNAIDEHGGKFTVRDMIDLNLARKL